MGTMTRAQLLAQSGLASGNVVASDYVRNWTDNWLQRTAASWPWPQLQVRLGTGNDSIAVPAGTVAIQVPEDGSGADYLIHKLNGNQLLWYTADRRSRGRILVTDFLKLDPDTDFSTTNASDRLGDPQTARVYTGVEYQYGTIVLVFNPVPIRDIFISFDAHIIPVKLGATSAGDVNTPWYPADRTLELAFKCAFMEQDDGAESKENLAKELSRLDAMVITDRDLYGSQAGFNEGMQLDPGVFR